MILFIYGASAIGKTTFLKSVQYSLKPPSNTGLVVVYADFCEEHHGDVIIKKKRKWGGKREEKRPAYHLDDMIGDDGVMWVVEAMRYLNGLWPEVIRAHELSGGGVRVIVPYYSGEVGRLFRQQRCDKIGKKLSKYWTVEHCLAESDYRVRSCKKHLVPVGIPCEFVEIGPTREEWVLVRQIMRQWLAEPVRCWYK